MSCALYHFDLGHRSFKVHLSEIENKINFFIAQKAISNCNNFSFFFNLKFLINSYINFTSLIEEPSKKRAENLKLEFEKHNEN